MSGRSWTFKFHTQIFRILGERKYSNYLEAINEIVADSLDGLAQRVEIELGPDSIAIKDDGEGMPEEFIQNEYLCVGKPNPDPRKRGMFGIGKLASQALSSVTAVESHVKGGLSATRITINWADFWNRPEATDCEIQPEQVPSRPEQHGTTVILREVKSQLDPDELREYLEKKHFPLLFNPKRRVSISVNGKLCRATLPRYMEKHEFDSNEDFVINGDVVPAQPGAKFGRLTGVIYLTEAGDLENAIHVFDRMGQRLDKYSTSDWLNFRGRLERGSGFSGRVLGILNASTEIQMGDSRLTENVLLIKSDRSGFFEQTVSFKHMVGYLIGGKDAEGLNLPAGGVLRLIHKRWMEDQIQSPSRLLKMAQREIPEVISILNVMLKGESFVWKQDPNGVAKVKPGKHELGLIRPQTPPENKRLKCPYCGAINYISVIQYKVWIGGTAEAKKKMEKNWPCRVCGTYLDPEKDVHRIASPAKLPRKLEAKVSLGEGKLVELVLEPMGKLGDIATYSVGDELLLINSHHALLLRAYELGDKTLRHHMVQAAVFAIAMARHRETGEDFAHCYNRLCSKASDSWD